jgi:hypothetical protein
MFTQSDIADLIKSRSICDREPWSTNDERKIDAFYHGVVDDIERRAGLKSRIEWNHYGSGYASFIDAWFYDESPSFKDPSFTGNCYFGVAVLFSRLSPFYVLGQGAKSWHDRGGSSYMPSLEFVDEFDRDCVLELSRTLESLLGDHELQRLSRFDLQIPLAEVYDVPTILSDRPFTEFDALFYWED